MDHAYFADRISAYHDHELPAQEQVLIEQHIQECAECRTQLDALRRFGALVEDKARIGGTEAYWESYARRIEERLGFREVEKTEVVSVRKLRLNWNLGWKLAAVAASLMFLTYLGIHVDEILQQHKMTPPSDMPTMNAPAPTRVDSNVATDSISPKLGLPHPVPETTAKPQLQDKTERREKSNGKQLTKAPQAPVSRPPATGGLDKKDITKSIVAETKETTQVLPERLAVEPKVHMQPVETLPTSADLQQEEAGKTKERAALSAQAERIAADSLEASKDEAVTIVLRDSLSLEQWRAKKDSLDRLLNPPPVMGIDFGVAKSALRSTTDSEIETVRRQAHDEHERLMIETCYQIARKTTDAKERTDAMSTIRKIANDDKSINQDAARSYLDSLSAR